MGRLFASGTLALKKNLFKILFLFINEADDRAKRQA